jgi:Flagellar biosynthesis/type III secretory pathway protein
VLQELRARFAQLEADGADALLDLALAVARQVVRREVAVARDAVLAPLREAVALVIDQHAQPRVHLHPEEFELLRGELEADGMLRGCRFIADASVARGGCRVETAQLDVDATVQTRWRRVVAALGVDADELPADRDPWRVAQGEGRPGAVLAAAPQAAAPSPDAEA